MALETITPPTKTGFKRATGVKTVSYTHLDVYKRQVKNLKIAAFKFGKSLVLDFILSNMANCYETYQELASFEVPKFPIDGQLLMKYNVKSGPYMGRVLKNLQQIWFENDFTIDNNIIMQEIEKSRF